MMFAFLSMTVIGQNNNDLEKYKKLYPNEGKVQLLEEIVYRLRIEKNELKITQEVFEEDLLLDESATYNTKRSLSYSSFFDLTKIEADVLA